MSSNSVLFLVAFLSGIGGLVMGMYAMWFAKLLSENEELKKQLEEKKE